MLNMNLKTSCWRLHAKLFKLDSAFIYYETKSNYEEILQRMCLSFIQRLSDGGGTGGRRGANYCLHG